MAEDDARGPLVVGELPVGLHREPVADGGGVMPGRVVVGPDHHDGDDGRDGEYPRAPPRRSRRSRAGQRRGLHVPDDGRGWAAAREGPPSEPRSILIGGEDGAARPNESAAAGRKAINQPAARAPAGLARRRRRRRCSGFRLGEDGS